MHAKSQHQAYILFVLLIFYVLDKIKKIINQLSHKIISKKNIFILIDKLNLILLLGVKLKLRFLYMCKLYFYYKYEINNN